jgi:uncharacterized protein YfdQ (DUF2303 family)
MATKSEGVLQAEAIGFKPDAQVVAELVKEHIKAEPVPLEGVEKNFAMVLPAGLSLHSVKKLRDEYRTAPERREGTAQMQELDSFIEHVKRFADTDSAVFADPNTSAPNLTAVLDYHREGAAGAPRFGRHRSIYAFPLSIEWVRWTHVMGKELQQSTFAEFIESNVLDIANPHDAGESAQRFAGALGSRLAAAPELMELSRGLTVRVGSRVRNSVNLATGEGQIQYDVEHQDERGAPINVPRAFILGIPVFRGGDRYQVPVRLRYRVRDEKVVWILELWRTDLVFDDAFQGAVTRVETECAIPVFVGAPEA